MGTLLLPIYIIFISSLVNYLPYCNNCVHLLYCHFVIDVWNVKESLYSTPHYLTTFYCYYYYYLTFSVLIISGYQFDRLPKYTFLTCISFPVSCWFPGHNCQRRECRSWLQHGARPDCCPREPSPDRPAAAAAAADRCPDHPAQAAAAGN